MEHRGDGAWKDLIIEEEEQSNKAACDRAEGRTGAVQLIHSS